MNAIAFSLFGSAPIYTHGAWRNSVEYPKLLGADWKVLIWCAPDVPKEVVLKLKQTGAEIRQPPTTFANHMFDRFLALDDPKIERVIFRDADSRPTAREGHAIKAWLASTKPFHVMRDHPHHTLPLGGGLWGLDKTKIKGEMPRVLMTIEAAILKSKLATKPYTRAKGYSLDQTFLTYYVWPKAKRLGVLEHDTCNRHLFGNAMPFPAGCTFKDERFVGEVFGADDKPHPLHAQMRYNFMTA